MTVSQTKKQMEQLDIMKSLIVLLLISLLTVGAAHSAEQVIFYHTDPVGTPLAMTDASGNVVWQADYRPFGEEQSVTGSSANDRRFVGKEKDDETGLAYFGARYEDAKTGRFVSVDPVGAVDSKAGKINEEMLVNPQRINYYTYGLNNPYRFMDPDGRDIAVVIGFPQGANRFGHVAAGATDYGAYSAGTKEPLGSSFTGYLVNQSMYRDSVVYVLPASKEQDSAFVKAFINAKKQGQSASINNCADITGVALKAAGLVGPNAMLKFPNMLNGYMKLRANQGMVSSIVEINQGNKQWGELNQHFKQFNPKTSGE